MKISRPITYGLPSLLLLIAAIVGYCTPPADILSESDYYAYYNHVRLIENLTFTESLSASVATYNFEVGYVVFIYLLNKVVSTELVMVFVHGITAALFLFGLQRVLTIRQLFLAAILLFASLWPYSTIIVRQMLAMGFLFFLICHGLKFHLSRMQFLSGVIVATSFHTAALFLYVIVYLAKLRKATLLSFKGIFLSVFCLLISILFYKTFYYDYSYVESGYGLFLGIEKFFLQCLIVLPCLLVAKSYLKDPALHVFFRLSIPILLLQAMAVFSQASERLTIFFYSFLVLLSVKVLWKIKCVNLKVFFFLYVIFFFVLYRGFYAQGD